MSSIIDEAGDAPLVVAGAGPVGLTTALLLADQGLHVCVAEAQCWDAARAWRGSTIHPPTLDILERLGLSDTAVARGVRVDQLAYGDLELDTVAIFDYSVLDGKTAFPFRLQYEQYKLLADLRRAAAASEMIELYWEHEIVDVAAGGADHVRIELRSHGETMVWTTPLLIACDGSHSTVRRSVGIQLDGMTYPTLSLVVATDFDFGQVAGRPQTPVAYYTGPHGRVSFIRTPDVWRVALSTDEPADAEWHHVAAVTEATEAHPALVASLDTFVGDHSWADSELRQHQLYRSHQRVAERFVEGRTVLVGDAAHLASTTGGMGLNSGIHDAAYLADALTGRPVDTALADYEHVRRRVAIDTVQQVTTRTRKSLEARDQDTRAARLGELQATAGDPDRCRTELVRMSMLDAVSTPAGTRDRK